MYTDKGLVDMLNHIDRPHLCEKAGFLKTKGFRFFLNQRPLHSAKVLNP